MTFFEWLDNKGREALCEELTKLASDFTDIPCTCYINEENAEHNEIAFYFELEDGSYVNEYLVFEEEDYNFEEFTTKTILKKFAEAAYDDMCYSDGAEFTRCQVNFINTLSSWDDSSHCDEELDNLTLYITPTQIGVVDFVSDEKYPYPISDKELEFIREHKESYPDASSFLNSELCKILQDMSDSQNINVTVHLYQNEEDEIAWFEFWPETDLIWDCVSL